MKALGQAGPNGRACPATASTMALERRRKFPDRSDMPAPHGKRFLISLAILFVEAISSLGAVRYVAKHGLDANPGTQAEPWLTIQCAVTNVASGDTILIGEGTYTENVAFTNSIHMLTLIGGHNTNDWSWAPGSHPTIIAGAAGARIQLGGKSSDYAGLPSVSNTIVGLTLAGVQYGIITPYHATAKSTVTISHCVITNQGAGYGIYGYGACDFKIINTIFSKADIGIYHNGSAGITGTNYIFNCTFVTNRRGNIWCNIAGTTFISNTISYKSWRSDSEGYGVRAQNAAHPIYIGHSLVYGNTRDFDGSVTQGDGMITDKEPGFVSFNALDYRPTNTSPCINAGVAISIVTNDLHLNPRPWGMPGHDIGAHEVFSAGGGTFFTFH